MWKGRHAVRGSGIEGLGSGFRDCSGSSRGRFRDLVLFVTATREFYVFWIEAYLVDHSTFNPVDQFLAAVVERV